MFLFLGTACAQFSGPGKFKGPGPYTPGSSHSVPLEEGEEDVLPPSAYLPSKGALKNGYIPKSSFRLQWPLNSIRITQQFNPQKKRRPHLGVDFGGRKGTAIFAAHEGVVIYSGRGFRGFGKMVLVEYDNQWASIYAHLDKITVKTGQIVEQGQTIGNMGRTGRATGVHLHFELLHHRRPVDPIPLLNESRRLVNTDEGYSRSPAAY